MKSYGVTIQMKATEQYFPVVLFIMLYKVVLTFESVGEILKCDHSYEGYWAVLSCGTVYYAVQSASCRWYYFIVLCFGLFLILLNIGFGHFPQGKEYSEGSIKLFL